MCECGCTSNDHRYWFPAPNKQIYLLTLSKGCVECDGPSGITIEKIDKNSFLYKNREDYLDGELEFKDWRDSQGVAIITGMLKHEFVKELSPHLVGSFLFEMTGDDNIMDESGAEVILEEMYEDAQVKPRIVV